MGRLVPQDPNDEPASELLKRIQAEKAKLVAEGKIKKDKPLPEIGEDEKPFGLPVGWEWVRWNSIAKKIGDIDHKMPETVKDGIPYVSPRDFYPGNRIDFDAAKRISLDDFKSLASKIQPEVGDIIYPRYGTIGENRLVDDSREFLASYSCCVIKTLLGFIDPNYQFCFSISECCRAQAKAAENKTTQANVGIKSIQEFAVPLPPLPEQHRIVAKVDELMALCDQLAARLKAARVLSATYAAVATEAMLEAA
jgi:type I restriction enzyme S subunit